LFLFSLFFIIRLKAGKSIAAEGIVRETYPVLIYYRVRTAAKSTASAGRGFIRPRKKRRQKVAGIHFIFKNF